MNRMYQRAWKLLILLSAAVLLLSLAGCGKYASRYKAVALVRSHDSTSAEMSFYSLEGRMVFRLRSTGEGNIRCSARLESGNAAVYYACRGQRAELFRISGGDTYEAAAGDIRSGTVYIIVETDGTCMNGQFIFSID